jgi:hypothetical protein
VNDDDCDGSAKVHGSCIKLMDGDFGTIIWEEEGEEEWEAFLLLPSGSWIIILGAICSCLFAPVNLFGAESSDIRLI